MKQGWCHVTLQVTLEGESVDFDDLSEVTQQHIADCIFEGYKSIEICEPDEEDNNDNEDGLPTL